MSPRRQRAVVMGLGRFGGGVAATRHLAERGYAVTVTDTAQEGSLQASLEAIEDLDVVRVLGRHDERDFARADLVVANPAVRPDHPLLSLARRSGARVTSELELFLEAVPARVALVTGTQGKSSTAALLAGFLEAAGRRVHLGGNIGRSLLPALGAMEPDDACVVEVSSYQLEAIAAGGRARALAARGRVDVACVTNVLLDHLERHGGARAYAEAKARVLELVREGGTALLPADDGRLWRRGARARPRRLWAHGDAPCAAARETAEAELRIVAAGSGGTDDAVFALAARDGSGGAHLGRASELPLPAFQRSNALVALGAAHALGAPADVLARALPRARGLQHRLEDLGTRGGHRVWDNGVSTTPDSTLSALRSLDGPLAWLLGGAAKELPFEELFREARARCRRAIAFGRDGERLARALAEGGALPVERAPGVPEAVALAFARMAPDEALLFSPACASFDAYPNFRERAMAFRAALPVPAGTPAG